MTKFLSMVAHDLKSPFSGILGLIKILDEDFDTLDDSEKKEFIGALNGSLNSQYAFMENLLKWGRLQMNDTKLNLSDFSGEEIIRNVLEVFKLNSENKNIQLKSNINVQSESMKGDMNQLQTVIHNLTSNALKYTPSGGTINIDLNEDESNYHFSVKDSGIGMPKEIAESLFSVNKVRSRPGTDNEPGTGLGLVLCSEIVEKHSGKIWVETEENKGTTFHFEIPKEQ